MVLLKKVGCRGFTLAALILIAVSLTESVCFASPCDTLRKSLGVLQSSARIPPALLVQASELPADIIARILKSKYQRRFDPVSFEQAKSHYQKVVDKTVYIDKEFLPKTFEEKLALMEAFTESTGARSIANPFLDKATRASIKKRIAKRIAKINFEKPLTERQMRGVFSDLYQFIHGNPSKMRTQIKKGLGASTEELIWQRFESEALASGVARALEKIGFLREPNWRDRFHQWSDRTRTRREGLLTSVFAYLSLSTQQPAFLMMKNRAFANKVLTPELARRAANEGVVSVHKELRELYKGDAKKELLVNDFMKLYNHAAMLMTLPVIIHMMRQSFEEEAQKEIQKMDDQISSLTDVRTIDEEKNDLLESYKAEIRKLTGRDPTPDEMENAKLLLQMEK